jgi:hypothetical protein
MDARIGRGLIALAMLLVLAVALSAGARAAFAVNEVLGKSESAVQY